MAIDKDGAPVASEDGPGGRARVGGSDRATSWAIACLVVATALGAGIVAIGRAGAPSAGPVPAIPVCDAVPDAVPAYPSIPAGNAVRVLRRGWLPVLRDAGTGDPRVRSLTRYPTAGKYLANSVVMLPEVWKKAMVDDGLVVAEAIGYEDGPASWGAEAFQLASPEKAADFAHRTLLALCEVGVVSHLAPVGGLTGATSYAYHDGDFPVFRATLLVGDSVVMLNSCVCEPDRAEPREALDTWVRDVHGQMLAPVA